MTYIEIDRMCRWKHLPLCARNDSGENVIIAKGSESGRGNFFHLKTSQSNGWIRNNIIFADGSSDEFYTK